MKLIAYKNNQPVKEVDFSTEIISGQDSHFLIGRSSSCHLILDDKQISREHAKISFQDGTWFISQISKMGVVLINGMAMPQKDLQPGDMIMVGPFMISVVMEAGAPQQVEEELPAQEDELQVEEEAGDLALEQGEETQELMTDTSEDESFEAGEEEDVDEDSFVREESPEGGEEGFDTDFSDESSDGDEGEFEESDDAGFSDDGFVDDDSAGGFDDTEASDDDGTKVLQSFAKFELIIEGEFAPYDRYLIENGETFIGRDPQKCQIVLNDPEVSGAHASIIKNNVMCTLKDLQSGNGTILNGSRINQIELGNGDEFIIGSTTFTVAVASDLIQQQADRLMPVEENQFVEVEEEVEVGADFGDGGFDEEDDEGGGLTFGEPAEEAPKSLVGKFKVAWADPGKRKKIIYGAVGLVLLWVMLGEDPKPEPKKKTKAQIAKEKKAKGNVKGAKGKKKTTKKNHPPQVLEQLESSYQLAKNLAETGNYEQALIELEKISAIDADYKNTKSMKKVAKAGFDELEALAAKRREEEERKIRNAKIKELVTEAQDAVEKKNVERAEAIFGQVLEMDPENFDIPTLKNELDAWKKEQERIALEKAQKEADRKRKLGQIAPGKKYYLQKDWHKAITKLETFLEINEMDEDLVKEATTMLKDAKVKLEAIIAPRLGKARSLKEGQDLKGAYSQYQEILKVDPNNREAIEEMNDIRDVLSNRARKIYRDALISESLSLFDEAKEKFNEVKQISPTDSEYYEKAVNRLKEYIE